MKRRLAAAAAILMMAACGSDNPTAPSTTTPTAPTVAPPTVPAKVSLTGSVAPSVGGAAIAGATVRIGDGPNAGLATVTGGSGVYQFDNLTPGNANLSAEAAGYEGNAAGVYINGTNRLDIKLRPVVFTRSGVGDDVWSLPSYVTRVRITATYTGRCQNFVVYTGGRLTVNIIIGTCAVADTASPFTGTYIVSGAQVNVTQSTGVAWTVTEVR